MNDLEARWHEKMLDIYEQGKRLAGYNATRFLQKVRRVGGHAAAKDWLNPRKADQEPAGGFLKLVEIGRLDISVEANALRTPWRRLFTEDELHVAEQRLREHGYALQEMRPTTRRDVLLPEEVDDAKLFVEGATTQVVVNAYERSSAARELCLAHYGTRCSACSISMSEQYGPEAGEFIHVHHIRPLATIGHAYKLSPVRDLRPVCPNCHSVIHRREPPYTIHEVQKMLKRPRRRSK